MKTEAVSFQAMQMQFCNWIRSPQADLPPSLPLQRMQVYRDLLFNNVCSFINLVYPITQALLPVTQWQALLQEFFEKARCHSPFYNDISLQFREYLDEVQHPVLQQYPWLAELLQFEWLELYLDTLEIQKPILDEQLSWQLNTQVWVLVYQYPVYQWSINITPDEIEHMPSAIMVWRNDQDHVCVERLSTVFALVIEQLNQKALTEKAIRELLQSMFPNLSDAEVQSQIHELKRYLRQLQLVYDCPHGDE